jgi:hypothetical protein
LCNPPPEVCPWGDRLQEMFDQLTLEQVMSISSYNFILEALFYAASH